MATINVDTTAPGYIIRHDQFRDIASFYLPYIRAYHFLTPEEKADWRSRDPLINDLLRFTERVERYGGKEL
jgi:hypothetical protein